MNRRGFAAIVIGLTFAPAIFVTPACAGEPPLKIGFISEMLGLEGLLRDSQLKPDLANQVADELSQQYKVPIITGMASSESW